MNISPLFITCSIPNVAYRRDATIENPPINLSIVTHFEKGKHGWYPDNIGLPTIEFYFIDTKKPIRWVFPQKTKRVMVRNKHSYGTHGVSEELDTSERDVEYDKLIQQFGAK